MSQTPFGRNPYRLIALDLDGTTLNPAGRVSPRTRDAIHALLARGVNVCFATGRNFTESRSVLTQVGHFGHAVFAGGAHVVDTAAETSLAVQPIAPALAREVCHDLEEMGHAVLALQDQFATGYDYLITQDANMDPETAAWIKITKAKTRFHTDLREYAHERTLRLGIVANKKEVERVNGKIAEKYGTRTISHTITVQPGVTELVEIFDGSVNKWLGIRVIADKLDIPDDQIIAVGDEVNDLAMLRKAGLGVAMGNAHPRARDAARHQIGHHANDGLAEFLEQLIREERVAAA